MTGKYESNRMKESQNRRTFLAQSAATVTGGVIAMTTTADVMATSGGSSQQPILAPIKPQDNSAETQTVKKDARPTVYSANKGSGFGKTKEQMIKNLRKFKEIGYDGMESVSPGIADTRMLREASEEIDFPIHGVVDMVHWQKRLSSPDEKVRDVGRAALEQAIKDAKAVGGSSVLLVPGRVAGENENHDHVWNRSIVEIRKVLPLASRLGIHVLIENVWNGFCEKPDQMRDYIDEIGSPWVGAYFDIGNCRKFGPAEDWIRTLGPRIVKLDVKDWGKKNSFCRLGEGDVNWPEVRKALVEIGYSGWATREGSDQSHADTKNLIDELL
jgi:hexulose-6-phosphate isomerase